MFQIAPFIFGCICLGAALCGAATTTAAVCSCRHYVRWNELACLVPEFICYTVTGTVGVVLLWAAF